MLDEIDRVTMVEESYRVTGPLNEVLHEAFEDTQARVASPARPHVPTYEPTGALLSSGRVNQTFDGTIWTGTITYGGTHGVDYAILRDGKRRCPRLVQRAADVR